RSFAVVVTPVNQAPTLDPILNPNTGLNSFTVLQNTAAAQMVNLTGITAGPGDVGQTLSVFATSSNPALVTNPAVTYTSPGSTGSLPYSVLPNQTGTATITVTVMDNGAVANGAKNTFSQTFTVTVTPVNQPPTLAPITPNPLVLTLSPGPQTVNLS